MGSGQAAIFEGSLCPWATKSESRHPIEAGAEAWETLTGDGGVDLEEVLAGQKLHLKRRPTVHSSRSTGVECHGADMAKTTYVCTSTDRSAAGSPRDGV